MGKKKSVHCDSLVLFSYFKVVFVTSKRQFIGRHLILLSVAIVFLLSYDFVCSNVDPSIFVYNEQYQGSSFFFLGVSLQMVRSFFDLFWCNKNVGLIGFTNSSFKLLKLLELLLLLEPPYHLILSWCIHHYGLLDYKLHWM